MAMNFMVAGVWLAVAGFALLALLIGLRALHAKSGAAMAGWLVALGVAWLLGWVASR